ncbi:MAG TPA: GNAT family N-acetyltransferase [Planctomycetota bacterium]
MASAFPWVVEPLGPRHEREAFECGVASLDDFLRRYARQNEDLGVSRTFVARRSDDLRVLGYYSLSAGQVDGADLPPEDAKRLPRYPVPVVLLGRLAVDRSVQGQGLGQGLLVRALEKALHVSAEIGVLAVAVVAVNEAARAFYLKNGFKELKDDRAHLFLSVKALRKLF